MNSYVLETFWSQKEDSLECLLWQVAYKAVCFYISGVHFGGGENGDLGRTGRNGIRYMEKGNDPFLACGIAE